MSTVKLDIPYRSQWDDDASDHEADCGPTCVTMLLNGLGIAITPDGVYQHIGPKGRRQFTTFTDLRNAALGGGNLTLTYEQYNQATALQKLRDHIDNQRALIALVKYEPWQSFTGNQFSGGHFVNVVGYSDDHIFIHDPLFGLWARRSQGEYYRITHRRFMLGWGGFHFTENPNFSCLVTDKTFPFVRQPRGFEEEVVAMPAIDEALRRRILSLAAFEGEDAPDLTEATTAVRWVNRVANWPARTEVHVVQPGDSYSRISQQYYGNPARWRAIQKFNGLSNSFLFVGQRLEVPLPAAEIAAEELGPDTPAVADPIIMVPLPGHGGPTPEGFERGGHDGNTPIPF